MKIINTKRFKKHLALLLSSLFVMQMPITSFADVIGAKQSDDVGTVLSTSVENSMAMPDIVCEIKEERGECKKEFLLEDGSYCSITFSSPIHNKINGQWVDKYEFDSNESVDSIVDAINEELEETHVLSDNQVSRVNTLSVSVDTNPTFIINKGGASGSVETGLTVASKGFYVKPTSVGEYLPHNKLITFAGISADCRPINGKSVAGVYEESYSWDETSIPSDHASPVSNKTLMSTNNIPVGTNRYTWNITDLYSRWDRGDTDNNGVYFYKQGGKSVVFTNLSLIVRYRNIDDNDLSITYHTIDMGKAGNLYLNDITNTFSIEQKLICADLWTSNFSLSRIYSSVNPSQTDAAGIGFKFNFESEITMDGDSITWSMPGGSNLVYAASNPLEINGEYQKWIPLNTDFNSELWIKTSDVNGEIINYSSLYVIHSGKRYTFLTDGKLYKAFDEDNNNLLTLNYSNGLLSSVKNADGYKYDFNYSTSLGNTYISNVSLFNPNNQAISIDNSNVEVSFDNTQENSMVSNRTLYYSGETVEFEYDANNRISSVLADNGKCYEIEYKDSNYGGYNSNYRMHSYSIYDINSNSCLETMNINSDNTFQRFMNYEYPEIQGDDRFKTEEYDYDTNYKLVTHKDMNDVYRCVEYNTEGKITSYVFSGNKNEYIIDGDFPDGISDCWCVDSGTADSSDDVFHSADYSLKQGELSVTSVSVSQNITDADWNPIIFNEDVSYVYGGWVKAEGTSPDEGRFIGIVIYAAPVENGNTDDITDEDYDVVSELQYDNTANGTWQFKLKAFKLNQESLIKIVLKYEDQINYAYFDDIILYKSQEAITDLDGMITSSPIEYNYSDGKIESEELTWNHSDNSSETMGTHYSYSQDGKRSEFVDYNGLHTYYQYDANGMITGKGHNLDNQNNISDLNSLAYDAERALSNTTQVIKNVENNNDITLSTSYEKNTVVENGVTVTSVTVTHNEYDQVYKYNSNGTLIETYAQSSSPGNPTNNNIKYNYENNDIVSIEYSNGYRDEYCSIECDDEEYIEQGVSTIKYIARYVTGEEDDADPIKIYIYLFDEDGELLKSYDMGTHILVDYEENGYSLYECTDDNVLIFSNTSDDTGVKYVYSNTNNSSDDSNNSDIMEITDSSVSLSVEGITTSSSLVSVDKNYDDFIMTADYERTSVEDFFGRLTRKEISAEYNVRRDMSGSMTSSSEYEYKALPDGKTSGLISGYTSTISGTFDNSSTGDQGFMTSSNFSKTYSRKYEYDNRGNVIFVYDEDNGNTVPKEYYEYDDANQVITEINFENGISAHYTYDAGGNLTAKIYYNYEDLVFNVSDREIVSLGNEVDRITYQYDSVWKDRLVNYNGTAITYDEMGNPLNYVGTDNEGNTITGTLEWQGNLLTAFESESMRVEYQYDKNDYRTYKIVYNKRNNVIIGVSYVIDYLWDNGTLIGLIISDIRDEERYELMNVNFIYDEDGSPAGYISYISIPYMFGKDIHENVLSLMFPNGENLFEYSYDSWGNATIEYSENWSSNEITNIMAVITARFCPMAYHGYLYDYETGMCFNKGRCYSPDWARNINPEDYEKLVERPENPLDANLYLFCNNNPLNILDETASWSRNYTGIEWKSNGFEISMNELFASRPVCAVIASQIIKTNGSWDVENGYNYMGMSAERIAADLFAHYVGKTAKAAINKVNAVWGDGWILKNSKSDKIFVCNKDLNSGKYIKIWRAAPEIKAYAQKEGIFINL